MFVNGLDVGSVTSQGGMEQLSVGNDIFIGGYDQNQLPIGIKVSGLIGPDHVKLNKKKWVNKKKYFYKKNEQGQQKISYQ